MKQVLFVVGLSIATLTTNAQDIPQAQVPAAVVTGFQQQFKNTTDARWKKKKDHYEVKFEINKINHKAKIDAAGKVLKHETDIKHTELPAPVQKTIAAKYAGYKIKDPEKVEEGSKLYYKVELKKDKDEKKVHLSADGTVISDKVDQ
ncbi:hypothetical protein D3H65_00845 [Paraflavitalea soli]|uniref:Putative beta-lactamase-inhibitor-like PepSY-like domain-containing protein n=1 Tax=Paraflavitalea soli TaxID=2315862 RepID=A0A3B7MHP6_9BACT|nr:PepSY-like domain-containing protein [Paraflavitalea soli]AXY72606.1 hypothetical protein D3H65_00845 [Paraflavitalea soli]